jgi:hypothetical protein
MNYADTIDHGIPTKRLPAGLQQIVAFTGNSRNRRIGYGVLALVLAVLIFFPRPYVARAKLLPQDAGSAGLGQLVNALGGQLQSFANLLTGGRAPNDLYLIIGRSDTVLNDVIRDLKLVGPGRPYPTVTKAKLDIDDKVDVRLLLGGVVEVETRSRDPKEAQAFTAAFVRAISQRIGQLGRQTASRKSEIVQQRLSTATRRVGEAQMRLDTFRQANRLAEPEAELSGALALRTTLEAQLQAQMVELREAQEFKGPESPELMGIQSSIAELRRRIAETAVPRTGAGGPSVGGLSALQSRYLNLYRDHRLAQALYEVYSRAAEQSEVENLVAESASYIQIIEPSHLDPDRKYNLSAIALLVALAVLALFTEWYAPATGLFSRRTKTGGREEIEVA